MPALAVRRRRSANQMLVRQPSRRLLQGTLLLLLGATAITVFSHLYEYVAEFRFYSRHVKWLQDARTRANGTIICQIPDYDPFDTSILQYVKDYKLKCPNVPYLTYVDEKGFIHLNESGFKAINKNFDNVHCEFYSIKGVKGRKDKLINGPKKTITSTPIQIKAEIVRVKCVDDKNKQIYENCHFYVPPPSDKLQQRNKKVQEQGRTNVLLLAIDSVSRLSFIRNLPKTYDFLTNQLQSVIMKGLNKVGKNTHPNMIPFLSGYKMYERDDDPTPAFCKNKALCDGYFDSMPIVWSNFSQAGYVTMWLDEWLDYQLFYYDAKGFKQSPTDYYPRPLMQGLESIGTTNRGFCFGNTPTFKVVLDYTEKFVNAMKDTIYFAFPFIARISHDDTNTVKSMDDTLQGFLERMHNKGDLDNTVLVIFGDHGLRFGEIRKTLIGTVEDRMPFMSIYLPKRLREQKPYLQAALEMNAPHLLSWFDMYEMLMDLAMDNLEEVSRVTRWGFSVGLSPFRPIPENRTCQQIGIPPEYCVCMTPLDIDVTEDGVLETAEQIVDHVNSKLETVPGQPCAKLSLHKVESAQVISHAQDVSTPNGLIELLRVTIWTLPNHALLQATFERRASNQLGKVLGDVERLNKYGNQSACVDLYPDSRIHPYCFCLTLST